MLRFAAALALSFCIAGTAAAQTMTQVPVTDFPPLAKQLKNPHLLYPTAGLNRDLNFGIEQAYYAGLTARYGHNIFKTSNEYTSLVVKAAGKTYRTTLESDVFEDTYPLIHDLDGDGVAEIITVQSSQTGGGSIAIYQVRGGGLLKIAQTPNIGTRNRWMNIAGIADFNGDGLTEIALVDRPHIRGELEFWTFTKNQTLELRVASLGFSNHFIGSDAQRLSAVVSIGGRTLLALPSTGRDALQLVDASGETIKVVGSKKLRARISENFASYNSNGQSVIGLILNDGTRLAISITP